MCCFFPIGDDSARAFVWRAWLRRVRASTVAIEGSEQGRGWVLQAPQYDEKEAGERVCVCVRVAAILAGAMEAHEMFVVFTLPGYRLCLT